MAVTYDNQVSTTGIGVTTLTTASFPITSSPNRVAVIGCDANAGSAFTYSVGGVAAIGQIPGCFNFNVLTSVVVAPPSGSQTATASWTGAATAVLGVLTFSGVDQTTPVTNGTNAATVGTTASVTIPSSIGHVTVDHLFGSGAAISAPTQNLGYSSASGTTAVGGSTYGPGTGTATHAWTLGSGFSGTSDGLNLVAVAEPIGSANIDSSAGRFIGWTI